MSISQFYILSSHGDLIINRDFRKDLGKGLNEVFFRRVSSNLHENDQDPIFNIDNTNYIYLKKFHMFFVFITKDNGSPSYYFDVLLNLINVIKDYCGILKEESIRKNFIMVYEIIDEMIDFGYPQISTTEQIKPFVFNEPIASFKMNSLIPSAFKFFGKKVISSISATRPQSQVIDKKIDKNEIFIDIIEKITMSFNSSGNIVNSSIDSYIQMKSYLKTNAELVLIFNDDLTLGSKPISSKVTIDDCIFHDSVNTKELENNKKISFTPSNGEFTLMSFKVLNYFMAPFLISTNLKESDYKLELRINLKATFQKSITALNVVVKFPVPRKLQNLYYEFPNASKLQQKKYKTEYIINDSLCEWTINRFSGETECTLICKFILPDQKPGFAKKEIGPINLGFEISNYNASKFEIKGIVFSNKDKNFKPMKWVRYITLSNSYNSRINTEIF